MSTQLYVQAGVVAIGVSGFSAAAASTSAVIVATGGFGLLLLVGFGLCNCLTTQDTNNRPQEGMLPNGKIERQGNRNE